MGLRFQRRFRIIPGIRLNVSKSGVSTSVGTKGAWFTIGPRGTRSTVGIPGTGISWTEQSHAPHTAPRSLLAGELLDVPPADSAPVMPPPAQPAPAESAPAESEALTISFTFSLSAAILGLAAIIALVAVAIAVFR